MPRPTPNQPAPQRLVSRSGAAALKGVSASGVSKACRSGGALEPALQGRMLDTEHPAFIAWLSEPARGPDSMAGAGVASAEAQANASNGLQTPTKAEMLALTKRKREAECEKLEIANAVRLGELISWELVTHHVFGLIDGCFKRLLGDASKAIASKVSTTLRAGGSLEEARRNVRDEISKHLKHVKTGASRHLARSAEQDAARARARKRGSKVRRKASSTV